MRWYPWLRAHFEKLISFYQSKRGSHALLLHALPGMGKDALIYSVMRFLACLKKEEEKKKSCGRCRGCTLMRAGTYPDLYRLIPVKRGMGDVLGIDTVRELMEKLHAHSHLGGKKLVWIKNAEFLTEAASNALLKILEEPLDQTWFFLSSYDPRNLLPTLRSRCCSYYLCTPKEEWSLAWLQREAGVSKDVALTALRLSSGAPGAALELFQNNHWSQRTTLCAVLSNALEKREWLMLLTVLNHEQAPARLKWLIALFIDALKIQHGGISITNLDVSSLVNKLAKLLSGAVLHAMIFVLCQCRIQLLTVAGLNRELVLTERLLLMEYCLQPNVVFPISYL